MCPHASQLSVDEIFYMLCPKLTYDKHKRKKFISLNNVLDVPTYSITPCLIEIALSKWFACKLPT